MIIQIIFSVRANRFFQTHFRNDRYFQLSDKEKMLLKDSIMSESFKVTILQYTMYKDGYANNCVIDSVQINENNNELKVTVTMEFMNPENLSNEEIKDLINDGVRHYVNSGPTGSFGEQCEYNFNKPIDFDEYEDEPNEKDITLLPNCTEITNVRSGMNLYYVFIDNIQISHE